MQVASLASQEIVAGDAERALSGAFERYFG